MLENNPTGLERAGIECIVGNQYNRLLRQKQDSKTLSASKCIITADRGGNNRRPRNRFVSNCFMYGHHILIAEGKITALSNAGAREGEKPR